MGGIRYNLISGIFLQAYGSICIRLKTILFSSNSSNIKHAPFLLQTKADHDLAANRTQDTLDRQRKHMEESVKKMAKAASGKSGDQKKLGQVSEPRPRHSLRRGVGRRGSQIVKSEWRVQADAVCINYCTALNVTKFP